MSWKQDITDYILDNLEDYANHFLQGRLEKGGKTWKVVPCPICGSSKGFTLTPGFNGFKCFSTKCDEHGNLIDLIERIYPGEGHSKLEAWSGIKDKYNEYKPEEASRKEKKQRIQKLYRKALDLYNAQLISNPKEYVNGQEQRPGTYQTEVRKHDYETLRKFKIGYSIRWPKVVEVLKKDGYTDEEIEQSAELIKLPEGYFVYPYFDTKGNLIRINAKAFIRKCYGSSDKEGNHAFDCNFTALAKQQSKDIETHETVFKDHSLASAVTSRGLKENAFFFNPKDVKPSANLKIKKKAILIEGEDDALSVYEALQRLPDVYKNVFVPVAVGGNPREGTFESEFLRNFSELYEAFDNDLSGERYRDMLNHEAPEVPLKHIDIVDDFGDIDEFLKQQIEEEAIELFEEMLENATTVPPVRNLIERIQGKPGEHKWSIRNRHFQIIYTIDRYVIKKHKYEGLMEFYMNGQKKNKKQGDIDNITPPAPQDDYLKLRTELSDHLEKHYHEDIRWKFNKPNRGFYELLDIYKISKEQKEVTRQLAWYLHQEDLNQNESKKEKMLSDARRVLVTDVAVETLLKEVNGFQNEEVDATLRFPKIQLSLSLFPTNNDAYMYFSKIVHDGEDIKRVPCLLSNKGQVIRLDLLKKKTPQSLLLIGNRYELEFEVPAAVISDKHLSLHQGVVEQWLNGEIPEEQLLPQNIIQEFENVIRLIFYAPDDTLKVLALWVYSTYFYKVFGDGFPYLLVNGEKSTGKSSLDTVLSMICFNPMFTVSTSEAALYRHLNNIGGTFILDEVEGLNDSKKAEENPIAVVLRSGYFEGGMILRTDKDSGLAKAYDAFGPKVISNINGLEAVLESRCIPIYTAKAPQKAVKNLKDPSILRQELSEKIQHLTSRAAISALIRFKEVHDILKQDTRIETGSLRTTQIMRPLITMARFTMDQYEDAFMSYYHNVIAKSKDEIQMTTLEGQIEYILKSISEELLGLKKTRDYIGQPQVHEKGLQYDPHTGVFEIDTLMLKLLAQQLDPEKNYSLGLVNNKVKAFLGKGFDYENRRIRTKATLNDEYLFRMFNNNKQVSVYRYTIFAKEIIPQHVINTKYNTNEEVDIHF